MRFNFVLWSMITTNVSTLGAREWDWKKKLSSEHAITQEYIKSLVLSFPPSPVFCKIETTHFAMYTKKVQWHFGVWAMLTKWKDCDRGENNCKVYRISRNEIIVSLRRSPIHLISVDCLVENLSDKLRVHWTLRKAFPSECEWDLRKVFASASLPPSHALPFSLPQSNSRTFQIDFQQLADNLRHEQVDGGWRNDRCFTKVKSRWVLTWTSSKLQVQ